MSSRTKRQPKDMTALSAPTTSNLISSKPPRQHADKRKPIISKETRQSGDNSRTGVPPISTGNSVKASQQSQLGRRKSSQPAMAVRLASREYKPEQVSRKTSLAPMSTNGEQFAARVSTKPKTAEIQNHGGFAMHRTEGMFDLSSIQSRHGGSVYDLLEEFRKQIDVKKKRSSTPLTSFAEHGLSEKRTPCSTPREKQSSQPATGERLSGSRRDTSRTSSSTGPQPMAEWKYAYSKVDERQTQDYGCLTKRENSSRVTTDSEEELLTQILLTMSQSSSAGENSAEDESDYANLWDSESGSSAFQTNKDVMGSLMRRKVNRQISHDEQRRKAWMSTSEHSDSETPNGEGDGQYNFNMDKFKSLQEKAENMDLTLADFFSDLKHSSSFLDFSKMFASTQKLSPVDCKYKCHHACEDSIADRCTGPTTEKSRHCSDQLRASKPSHHDADDADSGYSGSGGSAGFTLTKEEICSKIREYNRSVGPSSATMTLPSDDSDAFQGNIKVCMCITRPINMSLSSRPTSIYEALHREAELSPQNTPKSTMVARQQLPQNSVVSLHTDSRNTAIEVVSNLLNKFKITDNPKSFALFEQTIQNEKEVKLRKVGDQERPLINYLRWVTENNESKRFVLKENDSGDIMYEAFSIPELNNFLRMLEQEEADQLVEIQNKYQVRRKQLADRMREIEQERRLSGR